MSVALVHSQPPTGPDPVACAVREANRTWLLRARDVALIDPRQATVLFGLPQSFVDWLVSAPVADLTPLLDATFVLFTCRLPESALASLAREPHGHLHAALAALRVG